MSKMFKRKVIKKDMLFFALPTFFVCSAGMLVSAWDLARKQGSLNIQTVQNVVGLVLIVIALTITLVAHGTLRRFYSSILVIRVDHQLISHGIYRFTRHPIYLGTILAFIGISVYTSSFYGFLIMLVLFPIFLNRIRMEERMLTDEFGDAYRTYKKATSTLIPFI